MTLLDERSTRGYHTDAISCELERRLSFLGEQDRTLVELALHRRLSCREAALLMGINAGTVCRRLRRILNRLHHPIAIALIDHCSGLDDLHRDIGIEFYLRAHSVPQIACQRQIPQHIVRHIIQFVEGWATAQSTKPRHRDQ